MTNAPRIHAYVKCAMVFLNSSSSECIYQRTAVHRNSSCPSYDHKFKFQLKDYTDYAKFIQIVVWHRNRNLR